MRTRPVQAAAPIKTIIFLIISISSKTDFHHRLFGHFVGAKLGHDGEVRSSARYLPITERRIAITPASEHEGDGDDE